MNESEYEQTLSLSLVDGITCGLASALLLLIVFGVNMAASTATLGGTSGHGTIRAKTGDMRTEPVDVVVEILGPTHAVGLGAGWADAPGTNDGKAVDPSNGGRTVFLREIREGFRNEEIKGSLAPPRFISFLLNWDRHTPPPRGTVYLFRSGNELPIDFDCSGKQPPYRIITSFNLVRGSLKGDCFRERGP